MFIAGTKRRTVSRVLIALVCAVVAIVIVFGVASELRLFGGTESGSSFDSQPLLSHSLLGWFLSHPRSPSPVGIGAYGLYNNSGSIIPYVINTSEVVGQASISALSTATVWNDSALPGYSFLKCSPCADLQMNVNVLVETTRGNQTLYVQDVASFRDTSIQETGGIIGQIWNETRPNANISADSSGNGALGTIIISSHAVTCYCFGRLGTVEGRYSLPLDVALTIQVRVPRNYSGIEITLLSTPFGGFQQPNPPTVDEAYLPISGVTSAYIEVTPYAAMPFPPFPFAANYDAELVWTAYCCEQTATFLKMNSNLSLSYLNSEGQIVSFPSFYAFGDRTEMATNLVVVPTQNGFHVTIGENNNVFLGG